MQSDLLNSIDKEIVVQRAGLRERQRVARDSAILQGAFSLITERGYDALTMESLAEWVGITRQTLYHHFANKDEIVLRAIVSMVEDGTRLILSTGQNIRAVDRLTTIMRSMLTQRFSPTRSQFCKARLSLIPFKAKPEYRIAFDKRADALLRIVNEAQQNSEIRADIPGVIVVQMLLSLVTETNYEDLMTTSGVTSQEIVESVIDSFFRGISLPHSVNNNI